ncbi:MAG: outer membrane beta-barrel protein [Steroidobacteraceae bacterium]
MKLKTAVFATLMLAAGTAAAADDGFYAGFGIGYGKINVNEDKITNNINAVVNPYYDVTKSSVSQGATPYSLTVGYQFMKYLAVEVSYIDLGNTNYRSTLVCQGTTCDGPVATDTGTAKGQWDATGWPVSVLGIWPIDDSWSVFGRVGLFMGDVKATAKLVDASNGDLVCGPNTCARAHASSNSNEFIGGVGVDYGFLDKWTARVEWQAMPSLGNNKTGDGNWNNIQASILYRF